MPKGLNLQNEKYKLVTDSQDIDELKSLFGIYNDNITGAIVEFKENLISECYFTESNRPYSIFADYEPITYYRR